MLREHVHIEHEPLGAADFDLGDVPRTFPFQYSADEMPDLAHCIERHQPDPGNEVVRWALQFLPPNGSTSVFELLTRLMQGINQGLLYRRREAKGIQLPVETLQLGHGSCRDFAMLMIESARALGFAARFASGYLALPHDELEEPASGSACGSTHAWAQIYLPGAGWIDFDPTRGSTGTIGLITVAIVRDPSHATPLHGTYFGPPSDHLAMEVQVRVTPPIGQLRCMQFPNAPCADNSGDRFDRRRGVDNYFSGTQSANQQEVGCRLNNRAENSHQPFRRRERAVQRFCSVKTLHKFSPIHAQVHNHFNQERHLVTHEVYNHRRSAALAEWRALAA